MIKYFTKKELMYIWIEENIKKLLSDAMIESIEEKIIKMPKNLQIFAQKDLKNLKKDPYVIFDKSTEYINHNKPESIDYESDEFKSFEKSLAKMKKRWLENEDRFIKELKVEYEKRGITIILKEE